MKYHSLFCIYILLCLPKLVLAAEDQVELDTTFIKGNKELPQVLYVVPWKDIKKERRQKEVIVLHSLFDDTFNPVTPEKLGQQTN